MLFSSLFTLSVKVALCRTFSFKYICTMNIFTSCLTAATLDLANPFELAPFVLYTNSFWGSLLHNTHPNLTKFL